ncbi:12519_t:CDS:10, partial [Funneliformis geosporum]
MLDYTEWSPDSFKILFDKIQQTINLATDNVLMELNPRLIEYKPWFLLLFDDPKPDLQKEYAIKQGEPVVIKGKPYRFSRTEIYEIIDIAHSLNISEDFAATIHQHAKELKSRYNKPVAETAINLYYDEKTYMLLSLLTIFSKVYDIEVKEKVRDAFKTFIYGLFKSYENLNNGLLYGIKLMKSIETLRSQMLDLEGRYQQLINNRNSVITSEQFLYLNEGAILPSVDEKVILQRMASITTHRKYLAYIIWKMAFTYLFSTQEILNLCKMLENLDLNDNVYPYLIAALLAIINTSSEHFLNDLSAKEKFEDLMKDVDFINNFTDIISRDTWKVNAAKAAGLIEWSIFIGDAIKKNSGLEGSLKVKSEHLAEMFHRAVTNDAFQFITHYLLSFQKTETESIYIENLPNVENVWHKSNNGEVSFCGIILIPPGKTPKTILELERDFQNNLRKQLEHFVFKLVGKNMSYLQKIRRQEEDAIQSASTDPVTPITRRSSSTPGSKQKKTSESRHDIEAFFILIATLFRNISDEGLKCWVETKSLINWGASFQETGMMCAYLEMLSALATGPECSIHAYEFLSRASESGGWCSWQTLFKAMESYNNSMVDEKVEIPKEEVQLLISFLRVFRQVIKHCAKARHEFIKRSILKLLFNLVSQHIPTELKAELYYAIAAFCVPDDSLFLEYTSKVWTIIEEEQIVPTVPKNIKIGTTTVMEQSNFQTHDMSAIRKEIEEIESSKKIFFQTLAFIKLISTLIYVPEQIIALRCGFPVRSITIPSQLGLGYRIPGITPYVSFIIDDIFIKAPTREYIFNSQKWEIIASSLEIIEKCLISFDLTGQLFEKHHYFRMNKEEDVTFNNDDVEYLKNHPGYNIMKRLITNSRLMEVLFEIIATGKNILIDKYEASSDIIEPLIRCLKILWVALEKQDRFLKTLVPLVNGSNPGYLEHAFLSKKEIIISIALLLDSENADVCFYAVKILACLAKSTIFNSKDNLGTSRVNRLSSILETSPFANEILNNFVKRLELRGDDYWDFSVDQRNFELIQLCLKRMSKPDEEEHCADSLSKEENISLSTVSCAILDLILENLRPGRIQPTISHFLLGYDIRGSLQVPVIKYVADDYRESCLHKIMEILGHPINRFTENIKINNQLVNYPSLSARCYQILYRLCVDNNTSDATLLFLRSQKFISNQFRIMPLHILRPDLEPRWDQGMIIRLDKHTTEIDWVSLCANLDERTWLMKMVSLELRKAQTRSGIQNLLALIYGSEVIQSKDNNAMDLDFNGPSTMKILDILNMLEFHWNDSWRTQAPQRHYFGNFDIEPWKYRNERGIELYRLQDVFSELYRIYEHFHRRGTQGVAFDDKSLRNEMKQIIKFCFFHNRNREFVFARNECFKAWREVIEMTVINKHFDLLRLEVRESKFHYILTGLLTVMKNENDIIAGVLSKVVLAIITALRLDRRQQSVLYLANLSKVPFERLYSIFKLILDCLIGPGFPPEVRNSIYCIMFSYLHYIDSDPDFMIGSNEFSRMLSPGNSTLKTGSQSISGSSPRSHTSFLTVSTRGGARSALDGGNLEVLHSSGDRILEIIRLDASEGPVEGKLCALNILTALCSLGKREKGNFIIDYVIRSQFLSAMVKSLRSQNELLLKAIKPRPEQSALQIKHIFESRAVLLIRLAQRRDCALKLMESGVFEYLGELAFLDERPKFIKTMQDSGDNPEFKRFHELLIVILRLIACILTSIGHDSGPALIKWASRFDVRNIDRPSPNVEVKENALLSIGVVHEMSRIFYFLGVKLEAIDKVRRETHQRTFQEILKELMIQLFPVRKLLVSMTTGKVSDKESAQVQIENINRNLLGWCQIMTASTKGVQDFRPIFTPILDCAKRPDNDYRGDLKKPELSICVNYARTSIDILFHHVQNSGKIFAKLEKGENIGEIRNEELDNLQEQFNKTSKCITQHSYDVEILLLLIWRHLDHYISSSRPKSNIIQGKTALQNDAKLVLTDILEKLESLEKYT